MQKQEAEMRRREKENFKKQTGLPDISIKEREEALERFEKSMCKPTVLNSFYNPSMALAPEMSFNLARKTHKEYLKMKRDSILKKESNGETDLKTEAHFNKVKDAAKALDKHLDKTIKDNDL